ncbi:MAG: hypothetical protein R3F43_07730 [bacterium]
MAARTATTHELVDAWIACSIRAHLTGGRPPAPVHPDGARSPSSSAAS